MKGSPSITVKTFLPDSIMALGSLILTSKPRLEVVAVSLKVSLRRKRKLRIVVMTLISILEEAEVILKNRRKLVLVKAKYQVISSI